MAKSFALMPGPKSLPFFGNALSYTRLGKYSFERLYLAKRAMLAQYGEIYRETLGPTCLVQVFKPEDAELVFRADGRLPIRPQLPIDVAAYKRDGFSFGLGSLNGEEWYNLRKAVQKPLMHPFAAPRYLPAQNAVADDFLTVIESQVDEDGYIKDFLGLMIKYTMESIATVCFSERLGCMESMMDPGSEGYRMVTSSKALFEAVQQTNYAFPWFMFFRTPLYKQFTEAKVACCDVAHGHAKRAMDRLNSKVPEEGNLENGGTETFLETLLSTYHLNVEQAVGITTDLFVAGIDSTAYALSFVIYNLARNPDKQELLRNELDRVLPVGSDVTNDAIQELVYLKACVKESFRLNFPVEGGTSRILQQQLQLSGYDVPKGTLVCLNHQTMCQNERYFPDAKRYLPERWLKDGAATKRSCPPFLMLPFGFGPRMCIGRRFAEQEIYLALIKLVQRFRITYDGPELGMLNRVFTVPDRPLRVKVSSRQRKV